MQNHITSLQEQFTSHFQEVAKEFNVTPTGKGLEISVGEGYWIASCPIESAATLALGEDVDFMLFSIDLKGTWQGESGNYLMRITQEEEEKPPKGSVLTVSGELAKGIALSIANGNGPAIPQSRHYIQNFLKIDRRDGHVGYIQNGKFQINEEWLQYGLTFL